MVPDMKLMSRLPEPLSGSNVSRYLPRGYFAGIDVMPSTDLELMPDRRPVQIVDWIIESLAARSR